MIVKIFSGSSIEALQNEIQAWFDNLYDPTIELQIISVTQSESDGIINITIIAK